MHLWEDWGAVFDDQRTPQYRYRLWRIWDRQLPLLMFIGLNPSTANQSTNDPTIDKVTAYTRRWGYGGFYMMNLFAVISSDPEVLKTHPNPLGDNDHHLEEVCKLCKNVVFVWGDFEVNGRDKLMMEKFPMAMCIGWNKNGTPMHPMYKDPELELKPFRR